MLQLSPEEGKVCCFFQSFAHLSVLRVPPWGYAFVIYPIEKTTYREKYNFPVSPNLHTGVCVFNVYSRWMFKWRVSLHCLVFHCPGVVICLEIVSDLMQSDLWQRKEWLQSKKKRVRPQVMDENSLLSARYWKGRKETKRERELSVMPNE